jgi:hypothetical protein
MRFVRPALPVTIACALIAYVLLLAACGDHAGPGARNPDGSTADALPTPAGTKGSVTGMPDKPGPGEVAIEGSVAPTDALATDTDENPEAGVDEDGDGQIDADAPNPSGEPTAQDAVAVIDRYYSAIEERDFATAYGLWSDGGRASGQSADQFAAGFANTQKVEATLDSPARVEGAVGSRYIEIPVALQATDNDGRVHRFVGAYTLRRSVVDGASDEQKQWRIASADLRELAQ